jgi:hypothetical protein
VKEARPRSRHKRRSARAKRHHEQGGAHDGAGGGRHGRLHRHWARLPGLHRQGQSARLALTRSARDRSGSGSPEARVSVRESPSLSLCLCILSTFVCPSSTSPLFPSLPVLLQRRRATVQLTVRPGTIATLTTGRSSGLRSLLQARLPCLASLLPHGVPHQVHGVSNPSQSWLERHTLTQSPSSTSLSSLLLAGFCTSPTGSSPFSSRGGATRPRRCSAA